MKNLIFVSFYTQSQLTSGKDKYVQRFEMNKQLSERGSLILYLDTVVYFLTIFCTQSFKMCV